MTAPMGTDIELLLPQPARGGWLLMLLVGLGLVALGAADMLLDAASPLEAPGYFMLGTGLFLASFAGVILLNREATSLLRFVRSQGVLVLRDQRGVEIALPLHAIEWARCIAGDSGSGGVVTLAKKDGGFIEIISVRVRDEGKPVVGFIKAALASDAPAADPVDPLKRLAGMPGVRARRDGDALVMSWRARSPFKMLTMAGCLLGFAIAGYGFVVNGEGIAVYGVGVALALAAAMVLLTLFNLAVAQRVRIDGRHLTIERVRLGFAGNAHQIPLSSVVSVDCTHQLNTAGAGLTIRTGTGQEEFDSALEGVGRDAAAAVDGVAMAIAVTNLLRCGTHLPTGRLSLAAKIALELAIGDEVARRVPQDGEPR